MRYKKYTIKTVTDAEDEICAYLNEAGISSLEIEDSVPWTKDELDEIFVDEVPLKDIPDGEAFISFYLEENGEEKKLLKAATEALDELRKYRDIGEGTISTSESDDADWLNKWKDFFRAFSIELSDGRSLGIVPSWESDREIGTDMVLNIDPGTAFGTGAHETTRLCIKELSKYVKKDSRVLDLGTGSGILSMAAFYFGAKSVTATDVDKNAIPAVEDNFEKNDLKDRDFRLITGDVLKSEEIRKEVGTGYDVLVANILPVVLIPLCQFIRDFTHKDSVIIFSGILTEKAEAVRQALAARDIKITDENTDGEWSEITAVI